jgi:ABC-2 type transport system permease protein
MNKILFFKELKRGLSGFLIGTAIVVFYQIMTLSIKSTMGAQMDQMLGIFETMPDYFMKALNFDVDTWKSVLGFYSTYFVFYIPLIAGGFSIAWGLKILSKEEYHKTAEFLLTRPISRSQVLSSKLAVLIIFILGVNFLSYVAGLVGCTIVSDVPFNVATLTILHLYGLAACLFFGALGLFISVLIKRGRASVGIGIGIVAGSYLFDMILKVYGKADYLLYLTPFKYINLNVTNPVYPLEAWRLLIPLGASLVLIICTYLIYRRKDIYT